MDLCIECSADSRYCGHKMDPVIPTCPKCKSSNMCYNVCLACTETAKQEMTHGCDGPITDFVIISRGCDLAAKGKFGPIEIANAIDETLKEYGFMGRENAVYPTGS